MSATKLINAYEADGSLYPSNLYHLNVEESLECPFCFSEIETQPLVGINWEKRGLQIFLKCKKCKNSFIGDTRQEKDGTYSITKFSRGNFKTTTFNNEINSVSPLFNQIYKEAEFAEQNSLKEICGVGYRKALEFLIKDYLIKKYPEKEEEIKNKFLKNCIEEMIDNPKIKEISKRATWLGNDETHYVKKWEDKDLDDLKKLIQITVYFISMDLEAEQYIKDM